MKRARLELTEPRSRFCDFYDSLLGIQFTTDQLCLLAKRVDQLYAIEANKSIQHYPLELWAQILKKAGQHETLPLYLPTWLTNRTVCKNWNAVILTFETVSIPPGFCVNKVLSLFTLQSLTLDFFSVVDLSLLKNLKKLELKRGSSNILERSELPIRNRDEFKILDTFPLLTQLTSLKLADHFRLAQDDLMPLTNLKKLSLTSSRVSKISQLTNLTSLKVCWPFAIYSSGTTCLPRLTKLVSDDESFFVGGEGTVHYMSGSKYTGQFFDGKKHGVGSFMESKTGATYTGQWHEGQKHGFGTAFESNGVEYRGDWVYGTKQGHAVVSFPNGDTYDGQFHKGIMQGHGTYTHASGEIYTGNWLDGKKEEQGTTVFPNQVIFEGTWADSIPMQGFCTMPSGDRFEIRDTKAFPDLICAFIRYPTITVLPTNFILYQKAPPNSKYYSQETPTYLLLDSSLPVGRPPSAPDEDQEMQENEESFSSEESIDCYSQSPRSFLSYLSDSESASDSDSEFGVKRFLEKAMPNKDRR